MPKKRRRRKKKKVIAEAIPAKKDSSQEMETGRKSTHKEQKKIVLYLTFFIVILISAFSLFFFSKTKSRVRRDGNLNLLLITLDTTRADRIGCYGYAKAGTPNLDLLASKGVRFSNTYCQVPLTLPSHCSILTGTYPIYHNVHNNGYYYLDPSHITLAEILKERGYKTAAFVSSFTVDSRFGLDQGFEVYDDKFKEDEAIKRFRSERRADKVFSSFSDWLDKNDSQKFFCWVHFFDPHRPYDPPSSFKEKFPDSAYDGEISYMDYYLGKTIDKLKKIGNLDTTLIVIAGDHGEALGERGEVDHGFFIYDISLKVPFILYCEKNLPSGLVIDSRVRLIDIMPTILEMLEIPVNKETQGINLLKNIDGKERDDLPSYIETYYPREMCNWSELIGVIDGDWKYIKAPKKELFNIKRDPEEKSNLINIEKITVSKLEEKLKKMIQDYSSEIEASAKRLTFEEQEKLRSLGYLGIKPSKNISRKDLPDPKDKIDELQIIFQAQMYEFKGEYEKTAEQLNRIIPLEPEMPMNYIYLARIYKIMNKFEEAVQVLKKGIEYNPDDYTLFSILGTVYTELGNLKEALEVTQIALEINPVHFDSLISSAVIMKKMGRQKEAAEYFQKALKIEPENKLLQMDYAYSLAASGRADEALEICNKLKSEYPNDYKIHQDLGIIFASIGNFEKSIENFKNAVSLNPSPETYFNYALILEKTGNLEEAIQYLRLYLENTSEGNTPRKINAQKVLARWQNKLK